MGYTSQLEKNSAKALLNKQILYFRILNNSTMSLSEKIATDLKEAMKAKNEAGLRALRAIKSALLLLQSEKGVSGVITEEEEVKLLQKLAKQRKESIDIFTTQNRADLAGPEQEELAIIEKFLPAQMDRTAIEAAVKTIIAQVGAAGPQDMGKVMGAASKALAGQADNKIVSEVVKALLA